MRDTWKHYEELAAKCASAPLTLGADPEFIILKGDTKASAHEYMPYGTGGFVGTDGCSSTAEIRPRASSYPFLVAASCRSALDATAKLLFSLEDAKWRCQGGHDVQGSPVGGHIHMNWNGYKLDPAGLNARGLIVNCNSYFKMLRNEIEDAEDARKRTARGYGGFDGDTLRDASHGGKEYRPPPSWLVTPGVTCLYLTVGAMAYYDTVMDQLHILKALGLSYDPTLATAEFKTRLRSSIQSFSTSWVFIAPELKLQNLAKMLEKPALHYPELIRKRMKQVRPVLDTGIDWKADILKTWEVV